MLQWLSQRFLASSESTVYLAKPTFSDGKSQLLDERDDDMYL